MKKKSIDKIAKEDGRYDDAVVKFVYEGLGYAVKKIADEAEETHSQPRHVTGRELAEGLRELALERWGRLGRVVLEHWGVKTTRDFGEIVYLMIKHGWMTSQTTDKIEDFDDIYDFKTVFEEQFQLHLKAE